MTFVWIARWADKMKFEDLQENYSLEHCDAEDQATLDDILVLRVGDRLKKEWSDEIEDYQLGELEAQDCVRENYRWKDGPVYAERVVRFLEENINGTWSIWGAIVWTRHIALK